MSVEVVCLKWGTKYGSEYVNKLYSGISRNTNIPFKFHCFTEDSDGLNSSVIVHSLPFADKLNGWWNKLYLFSNHFPIRGKIVFIDLDTVITGNIDDILLADGFIVLRDFYASLARGVSTSDIGSGLMTWDTSQGQPHPEIWEEFIEDAPSVVRSLHPHGDQRWIQKFVNDKKYWQDILPGHVVSFKSHCIKGLPDNARVVCYHGRPSIPESIEKLTRGWKNAPIRPAHWIRDYWYE